jgi:cobalt-zinc-cadmium efflux system membrane fusion protein
MRSGRVWLGTLLGGIASAAIFGGVYYQNFRTTPTVAAAPRPEKTVSPKPRPVRVDANTLDVPAEAIQTLDIRTEPVQLVSKPQELPPFPGTLAVDPDRWVQIHARFPGEIVALGSPGGREVIQLRTNDSGADRPLRSGDAVRRGQVLLVVWCKDLGEKKSELVDALSKLKLDREIVDRLRSVPSATPERSLREAEQKVESDLIAIARIERTLRAWRLSDAEIAAIRDEAGRVARTPDRHPDDPSWARVEVRSPLDGVVLDKNVSFGDVVDTSRELFKIADLSRLAVWAHVYEEDLRRLPKPPTDWVVRLPAFGGRTYPGRLERIGDVIDPNQHTALVTGTVDNADGSLRIGQYVTVTIRRPAPSDELEIPAASLVEDGRESIVFVQPDPERPRFVLQRVRVLRRSFETVRVAVEAGGRSLRPGDRVLTSGAIFLKDALADLSN